MTYQGEVPSRPLVALSDHGEWLAPLTLFLVISIRILSVADGDVSTALGLVAAAGPLEIALQTLLESVWSLFIILAFFTWNRAVAPRWLASESRLLYWVAYGSVAALAVFVAPALVAIAILLYIPSHIGVSLWIYSKKRRADAPSSASDVLDRLDYRRAMERQLRTLDTQRKTIKDVNRKLSEIELEVARISKNVLEDPAHMQAITDHQEERRAFEQQMDEAFVTATTEDPQVIKVQRILLIVLFLPMLWILRSSVPWVPPEWLTFNDAVVTGYVIEDEGPWMAILVDSPRTIVYKPSVELNSRTICRLEPTARWQSQTLIKWISSNQLDPLGACPDSSVVPDLSAR